MVSVDCSCAIADEFVANVEVAASKTMIDRIRVVIGVGLYALHRFGATTKKFLADGAG